MAVPVAAFAEDVVVRVRVDDDMRVLRPAVDVPVDVGVLVRVGAQKRVEFAALASTPAVP